MGAHLSRRDLAAAAGSIAGSLGLVRSAISAPTSTAPSAEISRTNAAIHQEIVFSASVARVYRALTDAAEFDKVVQLSAAMNSGMKTSLGAAPTLIDAAPGGAFSLFGGYVTGRMLELTPNTRIVQAWRAGSWDDGLYSIALFTLSAAGSSAKLIFDHTGFPSAAADHLAEGWHINYWQPLAKSLG